MNEVKENASDIEYVVEGVVHNSFAAKPVAKDDKNTTKIQSLTRRALSQGVSVAVPFTTTENLHLKVSRTKRNDETILVLALAKTYQSDVATIPEGSNIVAINKTTVGSPQLHTLRAVLHLLRQETALTLETAALPE